MKRPTWPYIGCSLGIWAYNPHYIIDHRSLRKIQKMAKVFFARNKPYIELVICFECSLVCVREVVFLLPYTKYV